MFQRERLEKDRMIKELNEAQSIQTGLFPNRAPDFPRFAIAGMCFPCREVGGDWYDYIPLSDGRLAIVLADVSGKGMGAALLMSSTRSILRMFAEGALSPAEVLSRVNQVLLKDFPAAKFVTMIYAIVESSSRSVVFANAGHLPPLLVDSGGAHFLETEAGLPLAFLKARFRSAGLRCCREPVWSSIRMESRKRQIRRLKNTVRRVFKTICPSRPHPWAACWTMFVSLRKVIPPQMTLRW